MYAEIRSDVGHEFEGVALHVVAIGSSGFALIVTNVTQIHFDIFGRLGQALGFRSGATDVCNAGAEVLAVGHKGVGCGAVVIPVFALIVPKAPELRTLVHAMIHDDIATTGALHAEAYGVSAAVIAKKIGTVL